MALYWDRCKYKYGTEAKWQHNDKHIQGGTAKDWLGRATMGPWESGQMSAHTSGCKKNIEIAHTYGKSEVYA